MLCSDNKEFADIILNKNIKLALNYLLNNKYTKYDSNSCIHVLPVYGVKNTHLEYRKRINYRTIYNRQEIQRLFFVLSQFWHFGINNEEIGIITTCYGQAFKIMECLQNPNSIKCKHADDLLNTCSCPTSNTKIHPKVGLIEDFEKDFKESPLKYKILLVSTVSILRETLFQKLKEFIIGNQYTVLLIFGNPNMLYKDKIGKRIIKHSVKKKTYYDDFDKKKIKM